MLGQNLAFLSFSKVIGLNVRPIVVLFCPGISNVNQLLIWNFIACRIERNASDHRVHLVRLNVLSLLLYCSLFEVCARSNDVTIFDGGLD